MLEIAVQHLAHEGYTGVYAQLRRQRLQLLALRAIADDYAGYRAFAQRPNKNVDALSRLKASNKQAKICIRQTNVTWEVFQNVYVRAEQMLIDAVRYDDDLFRADIPASL